MPIKNNLFDIIKLDEKGLIPAISQDHQTGEILMMAWMNEESLKKSIETGFAHYFSRSRQKLWKKGETSGHTQEIIEILADCDYDCLLIKVKQGGVACHTGRANCFFNKIDSQGNITITQKVKIPTDKIYNKND
ncbi:MAG: phosphoribosyl-AMP cyclohydrolase [Proteobacteria bacterium]|nr:phosphoribosyl-AMP cyclohydrolase [Pseudomonadota bacterium]